MHEVYRIKLQAQRRAIWIGLVDGWRSSDLTAKAYSDREQIKYEDLKRWHYRLSKQRKTEKSSAEKPAVQPPQFIPLSIAPLTPSVLPQSYIDLIIDNRYQIRYRMDTDETLLLQLIKLLHRMPSC